MTMRCVSRIVGRAALLLGGPAAQLLVPGAVMAQRPGGPEAALVQLGRDQLDVTDGTVEEAHGRLSVASPKMRAVARMATAQSVQLRFTYLGPTATDEALASGQMRRQVGLKLRAADPCNLVYVMWRIEPKAAIVVSLKTNAGQHTSEDCGNGGYENIRAARARPVAALRPGSTHTLRAELGADRLTVWADGDVVWEGPLPGEAYQRDGPIGMRTDNARLEFDLAAAPLAR
jgi:hypothetical protein